MKSVMLGLLRTNHDQDLRFFYRQGRRRLKPQRLHFHGFQSSENNPACQGRFENSLAGTGWWMGWSIKPVGCGEPLMTRL